MKKHLLFVILALIVSATPLLAAEGTIAVYFTENDVHFSRYANFAAITYDAYVTIHVEDVVRGGSFMLAFDGTDVTPLGETYPANVHIGDMITGVDIGLNDRLLGFLGVPVVLGVQTFLNNVFPVVPNVNFEILPAFENATPIYADNDAILFPLVGKVSALGDTVPNDEATWGSVKSLYR